MSGLVSFLANLFGFAKAVTEEIHDKNQQALGANKIVAQDLSEEVKTNAKVTNAMVNTGTDKQSTIDRLRNNGF